MRVAACIVVVASGCVAVTPRLPVPLPAGGLEVSAFGAGAIGEEWDSDFSPAYADGFGGVSVAGNVVNIDDISVEVDGGAGAGVLAGRFNGARVGATAGFRGWWNAPHWSVGGEVRANSSLELLPRFATSPRAASLQPEVRLLAGAAFTDASHGAVWIGARPGVILPLTSGGSTPFPLPLVDVPASLSWCPTLGLPLRLGIEVGVAGPILPTTLHGGLSAGVVF